MLHQKIKTNLVTWCRVLSCWRNQLHKRDGTEREDFIPVPYRCQIARYHNQRWFYTMRNASKTQQKRYKIYSSRQRKRRQIVCMTLVKATSTICVKQSKTGLVSKQGPVPTISSKIIWGGGGGWGGECAVKHAIRRRRLGGATYGRRSRILASRNRSLTVPRWTGKLWEPTLVSAVSVAVRWLRWRLRKRERQVPLSCVVTSGPSCSKQH